MGVPRSYPIAERLIVRSRFQELIKVAKTVAGKLTFGGGGSARSPSFALMTCEVAILFESFGISLELIGENAPKVRRTLQLPMEFPCQNCTPRRRARRRRDESRFEQHALASDTIERWRSDDRVAIRTRVRPAPVVGDREEDVGSIG